MTKIHVRRMAKLSGQRNADFAYDYFGGVGTIPYWNGEMPISPMITLAELELRLPI